MESEITSEDQDPEIKKLWLEILSKRLKTKSLPQPFRDKILMKLLNGSNWTHPGSSSFLNLNSMKKVLDSIRLNVEGGEILVLNFVFQNLMLGRVDVSTEEFAPQNEGLSRSQKVRIIRLPFCYWATQDTQIIKEFQRIWRRCSKWRIYN